jgi:cation diffusion facilitator CzcD-associated flavoprotein CzcO
LLEFFDTLAGSIGPLARKLYASLPLAQKAHREALYWKLESRVFGFTGSTPIVLEYAEKAAREFLEDSIPDPELRAKLTPDYKLGCKRVLLADDYYPALLRPNVEVVTEGIERVTRGGIRTKDGTEREVDTLILATGFQAAEAVAPFDIKGRGGFDLNEAWRTGAEAYLGTTVAKVPNMFFLVGPNVGLGHSSMVFMIESQVRYVMDCVQTMLREGLKTLEVREDVQRRFNQMLDERLEHTVWNSGGCASWYKTRSGKNTTLWPGSTVEFRRRTRHFEPSEYLQKPA